MKVIVIAQIAHAINAAYCLSLGDATQVAWEDAPEWQQQSAIAGVEMHLANPGATPEQSHESWLADKIARGWVYGEVKDAEAKTHPCCRPYAELPPDQKSKDYLFRATVHALKDVPDAEEAVAEALAKVPVVAAPVAVVSGGSQAAFSGISVKYIGRRPEWCDHLYDSGLIFTEGQERVLPSGIARTLLRHKDLFEEGAAPLVVDQPDADDTSLLLANGGKLQAKKEEQAVEFAVIDQVNRMDDKDALVDFAMSRLQLKLTKNKKPETMRAEIIAHIERFGVV
jgi:hypothetical protein